MKLNDCKFLTDENIDPYLVKFLRKMGFDIFDVKEENLYQSTDAFLLDLATKNNRIIITFDSDFGTLIYRNKTPFLGIIYLRPGHLTTEYHIQTFEAILKSALELISPFILVAEWHDLGIKIRLKNDLNLE